MHLDILLIINTLLVLGVALISPGPDFILVLKNSLRYGKQAGIMTGVGIAIGCIISFSLVIVGVSLLYRYPVIKLIMNYLCSGYLFYMGITCFKSHVRHNLIDNESCVERKPRSEMFASGFLTNILNPKLYSLATVIMANVENHQPTIATNISIVILQGLMALFWFCAVARFFTQKNIQSIYFAKEHLVNRILGCVFIAIAVMLVTHMK